MNWLFYTIIGLFFGSFSSILRRVIMSNDKSEALASVVVFQFTGFLIVLAFSLFNGAALPNVMAHPLNYLAQGALWGAASYCIFKATKYLGAAEVSIISTLASLVTIVTAILFLGEIFTVQRIIGTALIILAVILVSYRSRRMKMNVGVLYALLYCLFSGIAVTNDTFLLKDTNVFSLLIVGWFTPGLFLVIIQPKVVGRLKVFLDWNHFKRLLLMTLVYALGGIAFYYAISIGGQASQVNTISQSGIILTTVMAALFLRERDHLGKKLLSAVIVVAGVLLLS